LDPAYTEATEENFEREVLEKSRELPVVVDFWAPWCGPCRVLGPVLERLAARAQGRWSLVKVNTDLSPALAEAYGIRGIPAVKAFRGGAVVDEFVGALPEPAVAAWLEGFLPGPADALVAEGDAHLAAGRVEDAESAYRRAHEARPRTFGALAGLARVEARRGNLAAARHWLDLLLPAEAEQAAGEVARLRLEVRAAACGDETAARAHLARDGEDLDARIALAAALVARAPEQALEHLLEVVRRDRGEKRDEARKAMLEVFDAVGRRSELADRYRALLARELYK
jgi:putative thioredoxin